MNVCLTQPNRLAGHVDSQRNFKSQPICAHWNHEDSQRKLEPCVLTNWARGVIIYCEPRGRRLSRDCQQMVGE